jgi:glutamate-1-semialdehyde aminotransferase
MTRDDRRFDRSMAWLARARRVVPGASQTLSKGPSMFVEGAYPVFLERGRGCRVWDVDGNEYVDYILGLASITLGYAYPAVTEAVTRQLERGSIFSLPHPLEVEVAERLTEIIPCAEMARFLKTGSEANAAAVRVARAATGRDEVLVCYHPDTEILTEEGFRRIYALRMGDRVATLNPDTGLIEYQAVLRLTSRNFRGDLIHFNGQRVDLLVTPDHHIYREFRDSSGHATFRLVEARTALDRRSPITMTAGARWIGSPCEVVRIPSARVCRQTGRRDRGRGSPTKGITEFAPRLFFRFLGYFLSEGWCQKSKRKRYEISLAQKPGPGQARMSETIRGLGFRPRVSGHHISFDSKDLWQFLQDCGDRADSKRIPTWVKALDALFLDDLFQALVDGDGTRNRDGSPKKFYSTSKTLADDVCELALKLGYSTTVKGRMSSGFGSRSIIYHVSLSRETVRVVTPNRVARVPYDGLVYCLTVPNHLVFVRRNGKALWSGNCGYHGWLDWYAITTPRSKGIPKDFARLIAPFDYNDLGSLDRALDEHHGRVAAVIMEPVLLDAPAPGFLDGVKAAAHRHGALLIFDEIVSGFRWAVGGGQEHFGVVPDLAVFGKGMANGLPLAAVVGRAELMREFDEIFVSSTFGGDALALAACLATLDEYRERPVIEHLWRTGRRFQDGFAAAAARRGVPARTVGYPVHPKIVFAHGSPERERLVMSLFLQETARRGVIVHFAGFNMSFAHGEADVDQTLAACDDALAVVAAALDDGRIVERLEGKPYAEAFRRS